jgi:hypothetical protein
MPSTNCRAEQIDARREGFSRTREKTKRAGLPHSSLRSQRGLQPVKNRLGYRASLLEMLDDDSLQQVRRYFRVPDPIWINDHDRTAAANAEAGSFATLYTLGSEEQVLALEQLSQQ